MAEYVYLMEGADAIKVGVSNAPERRLAEVADRLGEGARVVRVVECGTRERAFELESGLHKVLAPYRLAGERFGVECYTQAAREKALKIMDLATQCTVTGIRGAVSGCGNRVACAHVCDFGDGRGPVVYFDSKPLWRQFHAACDPVGEVATVSFTREKAPQHGFVALEIVESDGTSLWLRYRLDTETAEIPLELLDEGWETAEKGLWRFDFLSKDLAGAVNMATKGWWDTGSYPRVKYEHGAGPLLVSTPVNCKSGPKWRLRPYAPVLMLDPDAAPRKGAALLTAAGVLGFADIRGNGVGRVSFTAPFLGAMLRAADTNSPREARRVSRTVPPSTQNTVDPAQWGPWLARYILRPEEARS